MKVSSHDSATMPRQSSASSTPTGESRLPDASGLGLSLIDSLKVSVEDFTFLAGRSPAEVLGRLRSIQDQPPEHQERLHLLRELSIMTKTAMVQMNRSHAGLPPDTQGRARLPRLTQGHAGVGWVCRGVLHERPTLQFGRSQSRVMLPRPLSGASSITERTASGKTGALVLPPALDMGLLQALSR